MFHKILVCSDNSPCALEAARTAAAIAGKCGSTVQVLNVFNDFYANPAYMNVWAMAITQEAIDESARAEREAVEQSVLPVFARAGVPCEIVQTTGHPVDGILHQAECAQADLIVMGSRGLGRFKRLLLGSVSYGVLHHARCPVLIVHENSAPGEAEGFRHVLLASDGSEGARKAAVAAAQLAQKFAAPLAVVNVFDIYTPLPGLPVEDGESLSEIRPASLADRVLEAVMHDVRPIAHEAKVHACFFQETGHHAEAILRFAEEHHTDLIVMGSRGLGGFQSLLLGSVSESVAHHSRCPVLIVR